MLIGYISDTAKIDETVYEKNIKIYRNAVLRKSICGKAVSIGDDTTIERSNLGNYVTINRRSYINDSEIGDFSYAGINTTINFSKIGRFCSIARNVDIGGFDHDYNKITTMPMFRFKQMVNGTKPETIQHELCLIGNDVWIAAGAQVLHDVKIGNGAVIGGGAVVTKDVPPYSIVAGVPARIIKYRFQDEYISQLLKINWWDWPEEILFKNIELLINMDVTQETLDLLEKISNSLKCKSD